MPHPWSFLACVQRAHPGGPLLQSAAYRTLETLCEWSDSGEVPEPPISLILMSLPPSSRRESFNSEDKCCLCNSTKCSGCSGSLCLRLPGSQLHVWALFVHMNWEGWARFGFLFILILFTVTWCQKMSPSFYLEDMCVHRSWQSS